MGFDTGELKPNHLIEENQAGAQGQDNLIPEDNKVSEAADAAAVVAGTQPTATIPVEPPAPPVEQAQHEKTLEDCTMPELREIAKGLGMVGLEAFDRKNPLIAAIVNIRAALKKTEVAAKQANGTAEVTQVTPGNINASRADQQLHESKSKRMEAKINAAPKIYVKLPLEGDEKIGAVRSVTINGFTVHIPKGKIVPVSQVVVDYIAQQDETMAHVGEDISLDRIDPKTGKPIRESFT